MMQNTSHDVLDMHQVALESKEHRRIIDALERRDVAEARKAMFDHIQSTIDYLQ